jgi:hypothetical protein
MNTPTAALVREWATSNVGDSFDFGRFGYPVPEDGQPDRLERVVRSATASVAVTVGRTLDGALTDANLVALAEDCVLMTVQWQLAGRGTTRTVRDALSNTRLKSLRAGDYADTRRDMKEAREARQIHPWLDLSNALLALATPERRAELLAELTGQVRPIGVTLNALPQPSGSSYYDEL